MNRNTQCKMFAEVFQGLSFHSLQKTHREVCQLNQTYPLHENCFSCWLKRNQLDATCFIITLFSAQHVSDVNTSILRSLRLIRSYFMDCIWFGVCWRSVSVWLWWCGICMQSQALQTAYCIQIPHQNSHTETERQHTPNQIQSMK